MLLRSTLAIETRLSSFRPLIARGASRTRPCLPSQLSGSRCLLLRAQLQNRHTRIPAEVARARPVKTDEQCSVDAPQASDSEVLRHDAESEQSDQSGPSTEAELSPWRAAFADIFHGTKEEKTKAMDMIQRTEQRASALKFASRRSPEEIRQRYIVMSAEVRKTQLSDILVGCLLIGPEITLRVLEGLPVIRSNFHVRMDCLLKLRRDKRLWSEIETGHRRPSLKSRFYKELEALRERVSLPRYALNAGHAALILEEATTLEQGLRFFERYTATYLDREFSVVLKFVDFFTRWEDSEAALDALRLIKPEEISASNEHVLSRCVNLLKLDTIDSHGDSKNFKILPQLLELGVKPTISIHNMIIMNAIKAKAPRVGWDLYEYLKAENLETNSITHLLLMKDAFARQDVSGLNNILSAIHKREDLYHDPYLVGCTMNIIRIIYTYEKHAAPAETFSHILSVHNRAWLPDIYISLKMIQPSSLSTLIPPDKPPLSNPNPPTLTAPPPSSIAWTILQYCLTQRSTPTVSSLWTSLTRAILASDPWILPAARLENLYAGFIVFFGRSPHTLGLAVDVVQFMLDYSPHLCCAPTGFTWTRLMCGYLRQGQYVEAEQIRELMSRKGIKLGAREFAFLLESWPGSEAMVRAREGLGGMEMEMEMEGDGDGDEELFEGVGEGLTLLDENESGRWDGILDLRKQAKGSEEMEARKASESVA